MSSFRFENLYSSAAFHEEREMFFGRYYVSSSLLEAVQVCNNKASLCVTYRGNFPACM